MPMFGSTCSRSIGESHPWHRRATRACTIHTPFFLLLVGYRYQRLPVSLRRTAHVLDEVLMKLAKTHFLALNGAVI